MGMKTVVISSSLRKNSNSEALADEFIKGAEEVCHTVEKISLEDLWRLKRHMRLGRIYRGGSKR